MVDETWYGQLAGWFVGGGFWTGVAIGAIGVFGIYKYKRRLQDKVIEEIWIVYRKAMADRRRNRVVRGEKVEPAPSSESLSVVQNPRNTAEVAEMIRQSITRDVESLDQGLFPFENRTILPSSSSSTHSESTLTTRR